MGLFSTTTKVGGGCMIILDDGQDIGKNKGELLAARSWIPENASSIMRHAGSKQRPELRVDAASSSSSDWDRTMQLLDKRNVTVLAARAVIKEEQEDEEQPAVAPKQKHCHGSVTVDLATAWVQMAHLDNQATSTSIVDCVSLQGCSRSSRQDKCPPAEAFQRKINTDLVLARTGAVQSWGQKDIPNGTGTKQKQQHTSRHTSRHSSVPQRKANERSSQKVSLSHQHYKSLHRAETVTEAEAETTTSASQRCFLEQSSLNITSPHSRRNLNARFNMSFELESEDDPSLLTTVTTTITTRTTTSSTATKWKTHWRTTADPKSGRTYYYHSKTRETQWRMPLELASVEERVVMEEKERRQREFFAVMEANILSSMSSGAYTETPVDERGSSDDVKDKKISFIPPSKLPRPTGSLVRTISSMDESVLRVLFQSVPSHRNVLNGQGADPMQDDTQDIEFSPNDVGADAVQDDTQDIEFSPNDVAGCKNSFRLLQSRTSSKLLSIQEAKQAFGSSVLLTNENASLSMGDLSLSNDGFQKKNDTTAAALEQGDRRSQLAGKMKNDSMRESFGTMLAGLPEDGSATGRQLSFYGASMLDESNLDFGLTAEEFASLQELADMSDEIANVKDTEVGALMSVWEDDEDEEEDKSESQTDASRNENGLSRDDVSIGLMPEDNFVRPSGDSSQTPSMPSLTAFGNTPAKPSALATKDKTTTNRTRPTMDRPSSQRSVEPSSSVKRPGMNRRNTCGTLYVGSTMSAPDKEATIKCVCGVYRAHILQAEMEDHSSDEITYHIFNDLESKRTPVVEKVYRPSDKPPSPSLDEITSFYRDVFGRAQMEADCIIMSLIYVERLIKCTNGTLRPRTSNWRSILFSCMVLSSKVWDDMSMWNADFSQTCPTGVEFSLKRINELEIAVLNALSFIVKVPASEYAKYYFLLRSMVIKSGLGGESLTSMNPLDVEGAKRLQEISTRYQYMAMSSGVKPGMTSQRSKSTGATDRASIQVSANAASLEHLFPM